MQVSPQDLVQYTWPDLDEFFETRRRMRQPDVVDATLWAGSIRRMARSAMSAPVTPQMPGGKGGAGGDGGRGASEPASPGGRGASASPAWSAKSAPPAPTVPAIPATNLVSDQGSQVSDQDQKRLRLSDAPQAQQASNESMLQLQRRVTDLKILLDESEDEIGALREQLKTQQAHGKLKTEQIQKLEERLLESDRKAVDLRERFFSKYDRSSDRR